MQEAHIFQARCHYLSFWFESHTKNLWQSLYLLCFPPVQTLRSDSLIKSIFSAWNVRHGVQVIPCIFQISNIVYTALNFEITHENN